MSLNQLQAALLARETCTIIKRGNYVDQSGNSHDIGTAIRAALAKTRFVGPEEGVAVTPSGGHPTQTQVLNTGTLSAARLLVDGGLHPAVLNFASPVVPGGGFQMGALAQEEYLCRNSALYACLRGQEYYRLRLRYRAPLYSSALLYSPGIPVFRDEDNRLQPPWCVAMVTCAAPNVQFHRVDPTLLSTTFEQRIRKILAVSREAGHDSLVLGAWGCGAFGNDPRQVAQAFQKVLSEFDGQFLKVVFAVAGRKRENLTAFQVRFGHG